MTTLALGHKSLGRRLGVASLPQVNIRLAAAAAAVVLVAMSVFYIYSINMLTGGSYLIKNYNKQIAALESQNDVLQTNFAASGFMGSVQDRARQLDFQKTTQVTYIQAPGASLAKAN